MHRFGCQIVWYGSPRLAITGVAPAMAHLWSDRTCQAELPFFYLLGHGWFCIASALDNQGNHVATPIGTWAYPPTLKDHDERKITAPLSPAGCPYYCKRYGSGQRQRCRPHSLSPYSICKSPIYLGTLLVRQVVGSFRVSRVDTYSKIRMSSKQ